MEVYTNVYIFDFVESKEKIYCYIYTITS